MKIVLVASDSMGVRSLSCYVETGDVKIMIDPSAALGPYRYGLKPTLQEYQQLLTVKQHIHKLSVSSDVLVITHYHYDHYDPNEQFYSNKVVLVKDMHNYINHSQAQRAYSFFKHLDSYIIADNKSFEFGNTHIRFLGPYHHGSEHTRLGYVLGVVIENSTNKLFFTSDVEGPVVKQVADEIIMENPDIAIIDGPPTYFLGYRFSQHDLDQSIFNLTRIAKELATVIVDHHLLRDLNYKERLKEVYKFDSVQNYAEFNHIPENLLEARRKELYKQNRAST